MNKKYCSECGNELKDSEKFCSRCGANLNEENSNKTKINVFPIIIGLFVIFIVWFILGGRHDTSQYGESSMYIAILIGTIIEGFLYKKCSKLSIGLAGLMGFGFTFYIFYTTYLRFGQSLPVDFLDLFILSPIMGLIGATIGGYLNQTFKILD